MGFIHVLQKWFNTSKSINGMHNINRVNNKNHVVNSKATDKAFDKIQHPFMKKTLNKLGIERMYLNVLNVIMASSQLTLY